MTDSHGQIQGEEMIQWMKDIWTMPRSLTGKGVRQTLEYLGDRMPGLSRRNISSGEKVFDWVVPKEWQFRSARLESVTGEWALDATKNTLHVVGYSVGVDTELSLKDLQPHLHSLPDQPYWTPYVTSYYEANWGFCLPHEMRERMPEGNYRAYIDAEHVDGSLDYADLLLPGNVDDEIMFSTYICHPAMANNELSGPVLAAALSREIASWQKRHMSYRFVFVPETIGALTYISRNLEHLKSRVRAGFVLSCVGDERGWSHIESRLADSLADRAIQAALAERTPNTTYSFLDRGSDERQYCAPGIDLPVCGFCRSKYGAYPEYHTSADNFDVVTAHGLQQSFEFMLDIVRAFEIGGRPKVTTLGEPQLGKRGLYPNLSTKHAQHPAKTRMDVLAYCDGQHDVFDIARKTNIPLNKICSEIKLLNEHHLLTLIE